MIGAPQPLVLAKPATIDIAQAARYFGARGEPDDRTMTLLETCAILWVQRTPVFLTSILLYATNG